VLSIFVAYATWRLFEERGENGEKKATTSQEVSVAMKNLKVTVRNYIKTIDRKMKGNTIIIISVL
jgi:hypothetical protein